MRLIDANALRDKLQSLAYDDWNQGVNTSWANAYNECADMVDDMPTIEPQRMRGRWIPTEPDEPCFYQCSLCRRLNDEKDNFCKNCGAKMEGTE